MRTKRAFKEFCVLGGLASSVCGVAQERPNIIVFLVDAWDLWIRRFLLSQMRVVSRCVIR